MTLPSPRRPRRRSAILGLAAVAAIVPLVIAGCAPVDGGGGGQETEPAYGGTLTVAMPSVPPTIDPYATSLQAAWMAARQVCEPLFDVSTTFELGPVLVDQYDYDGDLTYVFQLREGVSFHNDEPFTANDVVASLERYFLTPGNGSILAGLTASLEATGDLEVTLQLTRPSAIVPMLLTTAYMMPASVVQDRPITDPANDLICTGPYKLTSYVPDGDIVLDRWDGYVSPEGESDGGIGAKNAYLDEIVFTPLPEASTRRQAVETGQVDVAFALPLDDYEAVAATGSATALLTSAQSGSTVVFNKTQGWMSDVRMRQAFLAALNMDDIMLAAFGNPDFFTVDGSFIPAANAPWSTDEGTEVFNNQDLDKVAELLDEAGYNGEPIVWVTTQNDITWYGPAVPAVQQLKEAGINIDLQVVDQATVIQRRTDPTQFDLFSSGIPTYADPVLLPYLQQTFPGNWVSPERDELLAQLSSEPDQAERAAIWGKLQALVWQELPFLKFGTTRGVVLTTDRTHANYTEEYAGAYYNVWVDDAE